MSEFFNIYISLPLFRHSNLSIFLIRFLSTFSPYLALNHFFGKKKACSLIQSQLNSPNSYRLFFRDLCISSR